jgi:hypothetical protein
MPLSTTLHHRPCLSLLIFQHRSKNGAVRLWNPASRRFLWWGAIRFWGAQYRNGGLIPNDNFFPNVNNIFSDMDDNGNTNASTANAPYAILSFLIENMLEFPFLPFGLDLLPPIRKEYRCWHFFRSEGVLFSPSPLVRVTSLFIIYVVMIYLLFIQIKYYGVVNCTYISHFGVFYFYN